MGKDEMVSFIVHDGKVDFITSDTVYSHVDAKERLGMEKDEFVKALRGYYSRGVLLVYSDDYNFTSDDMLIFKKVEMQIYDYLSQDDIHKADVWGGIVMGNTGESLGYNKHIKTIAF